MMMTITVIIITFDGSLGCVCCVWVKCKIIFSMQQHMRCLITKS